MTDNEAANGHMIRVHDYRGRLIFMYDKTTRNIEIIVMRGGKQQNGRREKFIISTDALRAFGLHSLLSNDPAGNIFVVEDFEILE